MSSSSSVIGASNFVTLNKSISLASGIIELASSNKFDPADEIVIADWFKAFDVDGSLELFVSAVLFDALDVDG